MIINTTLDGLFSTPLEETYQKLAAAGGITDIERKAIHKEIILYNPEFKGKLVLLDYLLQPAMKLSLWDILDIGERKRLVFDIVDEEAYLRTSLNEVTIAIMSLYRNGTPEQVENVVLDWEIFFKLFSHICFAEYRYKFEHNFYYQIITDWLQQLKEDYSSEKLALRYQILPPDQSIGASEDDGKTHYQLSAENVSIISWESLIRDEFKERLLPAVELKVSGKIEKWKQRIKVIECAAFCRSMFARGWFVAGSTKVASVNKFAISRYGVHIKNQLQKTKEDDLNKHIELLAHYFR